MIERDEVIELFEKLYDYSNRKDWRTCTLEYIKPYERYINILQSLASCIERNDVSARRKGV